MLSSLSRAGWPASAPGPAGTSATLTLIGTLAHLAVVDPFVAQSTDH